MFKNYVKMTWAVMRRRKFYTFISLFGISVTLAVLIVLTAFFDNTFASLYPEGRRDRSLYVHRIMQQDTVEGSNSTNISSMSRYFINTYISTLKTPEKVTAVANENTNIYINNQKSEVRIKYTDSNFWEITTFDFLEGKPFTLETFRGNDNAMIISSDIRDQYFGKDFPMVGKKIEIGANIFHIVGVVRGCPVTQSKFVVGDIYLPFTADKSLSKDQTYTGRYAAIILAKNKSELGAIQSEFASVLAKIPLQKEGDFKPSVIYVRPETALGDFIYSIAGKGAQSGKPLFFTILIAFTFLFMSLPALNLININISRIMERASEIGVRKAFGASAGALTAQFIIENIILTVFGGILALLLSTVVILYLNQKGIGNIPYLDLKINWTIASVAFLLSLIFGLLSGVYPAWRMAKLSVADALKN